MAAVEAIGSNGGSDSRDSLAVPDLSLSSSPKQRLAIRHSCNGFLLLESHPALVNPQSKASYYVCNPSTKEFLEIGDPNQDSWEFVISGLAFDPSKSPHYKVVSISCMGEGSMVFIYSSETGSWKRSCSKPNLVIPQQSCHYYTSVALWKGALHWVISRPSTFSFHLETEGFWETPRPNAGHLNLESHLENCLQVSCGKLKLIESMGFLKYTISRMGHHFNQWFVCHSIIMDFCPRMPTPTATRFLHLYSSSGTGAGTGERRRRSRGREEKEDENSLFGISGRFFRTGLEMAHGSMSAKSWLLLPHQILRHSGVHATPMPTLTPSSHLFHFHHIISYLFISFFSVHSCMHSFILFGWIIKVLMRLGYGLSLFMSLIN